MISIKWYHLFCFSSWSIVLSLTKIAREHTTLSPKLNTNGDILFEDAFLSSPKTQSIPDNEIFDMLLAKRENMSSEVTEKSAETEKFSDGSFSRYLIWLALLTLYKVVHFLLPRLIWRFKGAFLKNKTDLPSSF